MTTDLQDRHLPLSSAHNLRDMGGYPAIDGLSVRWGMLFRSGQMAGLSEADAAALQGYNIDTVIDLRANDEREERPTRWHEGSRTELWVRDHPHSTGSLSDLASRADVEASHVRDAMLELYRDMPFTQAESYRELFARLANGRLPVLFNCSAGKDRTGLAGALILTLLGVDRRWIDEDFMLSNQAAERLRAFLKSSARYAMLTAAPSDAAAPLLGVEPAYLDASFDAMTAQCGGLEGYWRDVLKLERGAEEEIRARLLG